MQVTSTHNNQVCFKDTAIIELLKWWNMPLSQSCAFTRYITETCIWKLWANQSKYKLAYTIKQFLQVKHAHCIFCIAVFRETCMFQVMMCDWLIINQPIRNSQSWRWDMQASREKNAAAILFLYTMYLAKANNADRIIQNLHFSF